MKGLQKLILIAALAFPAFLLAAGTININTADKETLMTEIQGIGEKRAEAIVAYRDQNGPFKSVDDLANVKGVGTAIIDKNRDTLSVDE